MAAMTLDELAWNKIFRFMEGSNQADVYRVMGWEMERVKVKNTRTGYVSLEHGYKKVCKITKP
jgi:hypothetical protein